MGVGVVLILFSPYLFPGIVEGSDDTFHLIRISSLATALRNGVFPVKFHATLCRGFGYGVGFFYPNLFLYVPAMLINLGVSQNIAYKIFAFLVMSAIWGTTYYSSMRIEKDERAAFLAASVFLLSNRIAGGFYLDFTIGNLLGAIFMPVAIVGMYLVLARNEKPTMLVIGFCGLIYTHPISLLLTFIVCAVFAIIYIKSIFCQRNILFKLVLSVCMVVGIGAAVWVPMLDQYKAHSMKVSRPWTQVENNTIHFKSLLDGRGTNYVILIAVVLALIVCIFCHKQIVEKDRFIVCALVVGVVFLILPTIKSFWVVFHETVNIIQFPARLLLPASVLICLALGQAISYIKKDMVVNLLVTLLVGASILNFFVEFGDDCVKRLDLTGRTLETEIDGIGSGEEWLPLQTTREMFKEKEVAVDSFRNRIKGKKSAGDSVFEFRVQKGVEYCDVPYVYYRGLIAEAEDGTRYKIDENPETGLARVFLENIQEETYITVTFEGTFYQKCSYLCTIVSLIVTIALLTLPKYVAIPKRKNEP